MTALKQHSCRPYVRTGRHLFVGQGGLFSSGLGGRLPPT